MVLSSFNLMIYYFKLHAWVYSCLQYVIMQCNFSPTVKKEHHLITVNNEIIKMCKPALFLADLKRIWLSEDFGTNE